MMGGPSPVAIAVAPERARPSTKSDQEATTVRYWRASLPASRSSTALGARLGRSLALRATRRPHYDEYFGTRNRLVPAPTS